MIGARHVREARQLLRIAAIDPIEAVLKVQALIATLPERRKPQCPYAPTEEWERRLHEMLGATWPCDLTSKFWALWSDVMAPFNANRVRIGRGAFGGWGDGEPGMTRAIWCLVQHLRPINVVETGVARGFTSRFILEALERNEAGRLWSIDLPPLLSPELHEQVGAAVSDRLRHRWSYIRGSSRRRLPHLLSRLGQIDLFIHDSAHTEYNVRFELESAWTALRPGGFVVIDDIDYNWAFHSLTQNIPNLQFLIYHGEPLEPDPTRFDAKGLFGIAQKPKIAQGASVARQSAGGVASKEPKDGISVEG